jgi:hypothetical protein
MNTIKDLWTDIIKDAEASSRRGLMKRSLIDSVGLYLGMDTIDSKKILILIIEDQDSINVEDLPKWEGAEFNIRRVSHDDFAITLKLFDPEFEDIFNSLLNDLFHQLSQADDNLDAIKIFVSTVDKWNAFFKKFGTKILSEQRQRGIYGELYFLKNHVLKYCSGSDALASWGGHSGKHQDFSFINGNVEVKTTIRKQHKKVSISSEKQLDNTGLENLFLYCITLNQDDNSGQSLSGIVNDLIAELSSTPNADIIFREYLLRTGYFEEHVEYYNKNNYIFKKEYLFRVEDDFPRIVDPSEGVGDVKYTVAIGSCIYFDKDIDNSMEVLISNGN